MNIEYDEKKFHSDKFTYELYEKILNKNMNCDWSMEDIDEKNNEQND